MGKKKGKKVDLEKKAALQAKKEAKADKAARKRLQKEQRTAGEDLNQDGDDAHQLDALLQQYTSKDAVQTPTTTSLEQFPPARANATLTLYEDTKKKNAEVYLFGGEYYDGVENIVLDHLLKLDLQKQEWKQIWTPVTPPARCAHSAVYYNHAIYIFGGELASLDQYHHYKDIWRYDIKSQTWKEICPPKTGSLPSARSGHAAVVWKHFMILFGGFYEALRDTPRWFNDVYVLDLQTETWLTIPHSKLTARPEPRSASNAAVIGDDMVIHGGFSKLSKSNMNNQRPSDHTESSSSITSETKVHTDAWLLHLKPILSGKPPTWERLTSSTTQRAQLSSTTHNKNPNGRAGTAAVAYQNRLLAFGGVVDSEQHHHKMDSIFYNDLFALDIERRKWFPVHMKKAAGSTKRRRRKEETQETQQEDAISPDNEQQDEEVNDSDLEEDESDDDNAEEHAWDISKLRSNMFAFIDGDGNLIYEKIEEEEEEEEDDDDPVRHGSDSDEAKEEEKEETKQDASVEEKTEDEEEKEEEKQEDVAVSPPKPTKQKDHEPFGMKNITASSVMALNPETKVPEAVSRTEPLPRINSELIISGHTLYVYGGLLEVGDREVTLDDFWSFDLRKREKWECLWPGTMHKQVWRGAVFDDDDSYYSTDVTGNDNDEADDDDSGSGSSDNESEASKKEKKKSKKKKKSKHGLREEISELNEKYGLGDENRTPQPGEALADFYARTTNYWNELAADYIKASNTDADLSNKEVKREGFGLAKERFEQLEPVMERLKELDLERKERKERKSEKKEKKEKKKSRHGR